MFAGFGRSARIAGWWSNTWDAVQSIKVTQEELEQLDNFQIFVSSGVDTGEECVALKSFAVANGGVAQETHGGHEGQQRERFQTFSQVQAKVSGLPFDHQVLQEGMPKLGVDPEDLHHGEVPALQHPMVQELPCEQGPLAWMKDQQSGPMSESSGKDVVRKDSARVVF